MTTTKTPENDQKGEQPAMRTPPIVSPDAWEAARRQMLRPLRGALGRTINFHEAYDPATDRWEQRAPMPTARSGIAAAVLGGRMFVFGGEAPAGTFNQAEAYDAGSNGWSTYARMPTARHGLGAGAVAGRIYVISGGPTPGASASAANEVFLP